MPTLTLSGGGPRRAAVTATAASSSNGNSSPISSSGDTPRPRSGVRPDIPPLSARALDLAAEAEATAAAAAALARGGGGGNSKSSSSSDGNGAPAGARPPPHYRFAAACISSSLTDEALAVCPVEDMEFDDDEAGGTKGSARAPSSAPPASSSGAPAAAVRLPASMSLLPSAHGRADDRSAEPEKQQEQQKHQRRTRQRALLQWAAGGPRRCLIVKKAGAVEPRRKMVQIANWLAEKGVACFVERAVHASELPGLPPFDPRSTAVDFAVTLGGDGTVLHLASMFEGGDTPLPPVICFAMGTLGFLTAFSADDYEACLERVLAGDRHPLYCTLRSRTRVDVLVPVPNEGDGGGDESDNNGANGDSLLGEAEEQEAERQREEDAAAEGGSSGASPPSSPDGDAANNNGRRRRASRPTVRLASTRHVLNECVVDRGAFPHAVYIEIFVDGAFVTAAEADGLVVATPSGSTAYSMSAGGPMVSPSVSCTLLTPLSPQSLSFRPLVIPGSSELLISIPRYARSHARLSFDGRSGRRLPRGSALRVTTSSCPLPFINLKPLDGDFYDAIVEKLRWNNLIRGRAGERPVPPVVLDPLDEGDDEDEAERDDRGGLAPPCLPPPPPADAFIPLAQA